MMIAKIGNARWTKTSKDLNPLFCYNDGYPTQKALTVILHQIIFMPENILENLKNMVIALAGVLDTHMDG